MKLKKKVYSNDEQCTDTEAQTHLMSQIKGGIDFLIIHVNWFVGFIVIKFMPITIDCLEKFNFL